jgi:predicted RNA-binding protein YlqC (UPF0109 family)
MGSVDYAVLVAGLIKPLVTHPEAVVVNVESIEDGNVKVVALVHQDDLGRVIGKKGRVAGAIRTLAHAAAIRNKETVEIEFNGSEE